MGDGGCPYRDRDPTSLKIRYERFVRDNVGNYIIKIKIKKDGS